MIYFRASRAKLAGVCLLLAGCGRAPNIDIIGSFFPVWMLCIAIAIPLTFLARRLLVRFHLETVVGPLALFYPCVTILFTSLLWLIFFR
jgi:YtcA family